MTKEKATSTLKRVQLDLAPGAFSDLEFVKTETESASYAEVVRRAIKFIRMLLSRKKLGATFYVKEKDGQLIELIF